jgi:hypothetical protein
MGEFIRDSCAYESYSGKQYKKRDEVIILVDKKRTPHTAHEIHLRRREKPISP